jgi:hypothetical protein
MSAECATITNTGFVVGDEAVVIIDGGGVRGKGRRLRAAVQQIADKLDQVRHQHP